MAKHAQYILVVDDDPDDLMIIDHFFSQLCAQITVVTVSGAEALLSYLDAGPAFLPAFILTDLNMPRLGGQQLLCALKSNIKYKSIPVLVLSTSNNRREIQACYAAGASAYITKPYTVEKWNHVLKNVCAFWFDTVQLP